MASTPSVSSRQNCAGSLAVRPRQEVPSCVGTGSSVRHSLDKRRLSRRRSVCAGVGRAICRDAGPATSWVGDEVDAPPSPCPTRSGRREGDRGAAGIRPRDGWRGVGGGRRDGRVHADPPDSGHSLYAARSGPSASPAQREVRRRRVNVPPWRARVNGNRAPIDPELVCRAVAPTPTRLAPGFRQNPERADTGTFCSRESPSGATLGNGVRPPRSVESWAENAARLGESHRAAAADRRMTC
jgi:hypothetical protein